MVGPISTYSLVGQGNFNSEALQVDNEQDHQ